MQNKNFWCADPAAAAAALRAQYPRAAERACAIADDVCANRFLFRDHWEMERTNVPVQFGPEEKDIDWALIPAGDPEWIYAMNRHTSFVNLAKAWLLTGDERYAQKYARLIEDWIDRVPLTGESRNDTWRSLEAGLRCENWLRALELLAGSGVPGAALRQKIETCLRQHGGYLAAASNTFHRLSNWGVLQDHGLFLLGVYFDRADWRQLALSRLDENLHHAVFGDGSQWEQSPMYHCEVLHNALDVVLVGRKAGVPLPAPFTDAVHRMCRALAAWVKPDGRLPMQSDSDDMDARDLLAAGALLFEDGALRALAGDALLPENLWDFGPEAAARYGELAPDLAALGSAALPDSGNYMLRGAQGAWAHMHCGCLGSGHGHADLLHLDAGVAGEDVLIDSGRYTYVDSAIRRQLKLPAAHNTTRVDGQDFSACVDSWGYSRLAVPLKGEHRFTPQADYISGLHLGYLDRGAVVGRKVVFLKEQGLAVIFDQLYAAGEHLFEQRFHFAPGTLVPAGDGACWQGRRPPALPGGRAGTGVEPGTLFPGIQPAGGGRRADLPPPHRRLQLVRDGTLAGRRRPPPPAHGGTAAGHPPAPGRYPARRHGPGRAHRQGRAADRGGRLPRRGHQRGGSAGGGRLRRLRQAAGIHRRLQARALPGVVKRAQKTAARGACLRAAGWGGAAACVIPCRRAAASGIRWGSCRCSA